MRDLVPGIERTGLGLARTHPTYEKMETGCFNREDIREFVRELGVVDTMGLLPVS